MFRVRGLDSFCTNPCSNPRTLALFHLRGPLSWSPAFAIQPPAHACSQSNSSKDLLLLSLARAADRSGTSRPSSARFHCHSRPGSDRASRAAPAPIPDSHTKSRPMLPSAASFPSQPRPKIFWCFAWKTPSVSFAFTAPTAAPGVAPSAICCRQRCSDRQFGPATQAGTVRRWQGRDWRWQHCLPTSRPTGSPATASAGSPFRSKPVST